MIDTDPDPGKWYKSGWIQTWIRKTNIQFHIRFANCILHMHIEYACYIGMLQMHIDYQYCICILHFHNVLEFCIFHLHVTFWIFYSKQFKFCVLTQNLTFFKFKNLDLDCAFILISVKKNTQLISFIC